MNFNELTFNWAFPVGTGIYRNPRPAKTGDISVPCGYRDIPASLSPALATSMRSLWVQGYTALGSKAELTEDAFPVGTGIYRF